MRLAGWHPSRLRSFVVAVAVLSAWASTALAQTPWPGQPGNTVGYAASPTWTGSFSATACGAPSNGTSWDTATVIHDCTYATPQTLTCEYCEFINVDFNSGTTVTDVSGSHILFIGDRFQSNDVEGGNVGVLGVDIYFFYDSVVPLVSLAASPPGYAWPSAGAGANSTAIIEGTNAINGNDGYEYGFNIGDASGVGGPVWIDHCDLWGFGDAIVIQTTTAPMTITNNHMHDIADPAEQVYHTDGPGYSNGAVAPNNVTMIGNTVAMLGNTNALAFQAATGGYQNIYVASNFWSGDNATISWCRPGSVQCTSSYFYGNTFGTDVMDFGVVYDPGVALGSESVWACNTIEVRSGTTWTNMDGWKPTSAMNGQYLVNAFPPNSATDQGGNTHCGLASPSSINFGNQGKGTSSAGREITFTSTSSADLAISSIALETGTQFSIASKTCGATLTSGSHCTVTVKFSPTAVGPETDLLKITDNTSGVTSPQLVPLAGLGVIGGESDGGLSSDAGAQSDASPDGGSRDASIGKSDSGASSRPDSGGHAGADSGGRGRVDSGGNADVDSGASGPNGATSSTAGCGCRVVPARSPLGFAGLLCAVPALLVRRVMRRSKSAGRAGRV